MHAVVELRRHSGRQGDKDEESPMCYTSVDQEEGRHGSGRVRCGRNAKGPKGLRNECGMVD